MSFLDQSLSPDIGLLSISVDPITDSIPVLKKYANLYENSDRWVFATGKEDKIYDLIMNNFLLSIDKKDTFDTSGDLITHSTKFVLLNTKAQIVHYFDGNHLSEIKNIQKKVRKLKLQQDAVWMYYSPSINACLNFLSLLMLIYGYFLIRFKRNIVKHRICMIVATCCSFLFLVNYLIYHYFQGATKFISQWMTKMIYFSILIPHTIFAVGIFPFILILLFYAYKRDFVRHRYLAQKILPVWIYVSTSGLVVYYMLYHL